MLWPLRDAKPQIMSERWGSLILGRPVSPLCLEFASPCPSRPASLCSQLGELVLAGPSISSTPQSISSGRQERFNLANSSYLTFVFGLEMFFSIVSRLRWFCVFRTQTYLGFLIFHIIDKVKLTFLLFPLVLNPHLILFWNSSAFVSHTQLKRSWLEPSHKHTVLLLSKSKTKLFSDQCHGHGCIVQIISCTGFFYLFLKENLTLVISGSLG